MYVVVQKQRRCVWWRSSFCTHTHTKVKKKVGLNSLWKDTLQYENWNKKAQHGYQLGICASKYAKFPPLYKYQTARVTGKFGLGIRNEAGQRRIEFCQENALVIANTLFQQQKRRLYTWISPHGQHQNQTDYILCSQRWRSSIQSAKTRPVADCGSDHELLIAKLRLKLKKVGKTTRSDQAPDSLCSSGWQNMITRLCRGWFAAE